ncbi:DUF262 domain-containing protein [Rathayibacter soli]|uniref:DUF262 domain-containing protein n=1 Tax=Rathayibacter soli TaxID=3144168 RepID=UPI0027E4F8BF|nr:DUF262 domain-containing protein [Glaciibacter superstes]
MNGHRTTFMGLFDERDGRPDITAIEIPMIQRDFAQGRQDDATRVIRDRFLDTLIDAATGATSPIGLDFVYGELPNNGLLRPLDGQQRLTTLFLLHWYIACRAGTLDTDAAWLRLTYATRPSARDFCQTLATHPLPDDAASPSAWATDEPWYVFPWQQDPTIQSMLVMLDSIQERLSSPGTDFYDLWRRLADRENPPIWFLFLPIEDTDRGEDLYIKMNSRGKPLTPFEVFKAELEDLLVPVLDLAEHRHLIDSIDGSWTNLLWEYEKTGDGDFEIDQEFIRYFRFIIDVSEWRNGARTRRTLEAGLSDELPLEKRARRLFADATNPDAAANRAFFFNAFDTWCGTESPDTVFSRLFRANGEGDGPLPLLLSTSPDLFQACISGYGTSFTTTETLMLFAVLIARQASIDDTQLDRRLRTLRNLTESWNLDSKRMAEYIGAVERLIIDGTLDNAPGFNQGWVVDERLKWETLDAHPEATGAVHLLEDHPLIRGRLLAFDLDTDLLGQRQVAFEAVAGPELRDALGAALLTKGDYSRDTGWNGRRRQLGNSQSDESWRDMLTAQNRDTQTGRREPLMLLLDDITERMAEGDVTAAETLEQIQSDWLGLCDRRGLFDWRYYLVRYPGARSTRGVGYYNGEYDPETGGFHAGRFRLLNGSNYSAKFSDVILRAVWFQGHLAPDVAEPEWWHKDDPGMSFRASHLELRNCDDRFEIITPEGYPAEDSRLQALSMEFLDLHGNELLIPQSERDGRNVDDVDRVQLGLRLSRAMVAARL